MRNDVLKFEAIVTYLNQKLYQFQFNNIIIYKFRRIWSIF